MNHAHKSALKTRLKLSLGRLLHPQATRDWQAFLREHPCLHERQTRHPVLAHKIYRPYLSAELGCRQRVQVLTEHYRHLQSCGLLDWACEAAEQPHVLAELTLKDGEQAQLQLSAIHDGHREGELCLSLHVGGRRLYTMSLVIRQREGQPVLVVGRLQGLACEQARQLVRDTTRQLHACRPSGLMVLVARHLAYVLGCQRVELISNRHRIALNPWRRWRISANYDQLWRELGAVPAAHGNFQLDCLREPSIDLQDMPSKKRAEARRREALLRAACASVAASLHRAAPALEISEPYPLAA